MPKTLELFELSRLSGLSTIPGNLELSELSAISGLEHWTCLNCLVGCLRSSCLKTFELSGLSTNSGKPERKYNFGMHLVGTCSSSELEKTIFSVPKPVFYNEFIGTIEDRAWQELESSFAVAAVGPTPTLCAHHP